MVSLKTVFATLAAAIGANAAAGSLQQVTGSFGTNPNNVGFYYYKPANLPAKPALIVAIHYCTGSAQAYFSGTQYANLADTNKYIVIYPDSPRSGKCFDVHSPQTLSHNGGGDSQGIASMVAYAISTWGVDAGRVFVTGSSSGAMMTNVMAGSYPNLFQAASAYSGVPFACFAGSGEWNSSCANGQTSKTGPQWGDLVRAAYPGYSGPRPRMMLWHGTADTTLYYANLQQEILEWTNVLGVSSTPTTTTQNDPQSSYTHTAYGCVVQAYSGAGVGHTVPVHESIDLQWFGITAGGPSCVGGTTTTTTNGVTTTTNGVTTTTPTTSQTTTTTTTTSGGATAPHWGQCGGQGWTGPTVCAAPYTCQYSNAWYSQCL
ncbi:carbohydrate-binding module family 1 protein [Tulasnella calospora MUT 4182]|uniref:Carboxylic ester hydrolase n=1 Tax=Tulasnella calospora MUT 4182 TaxID=1051891 RepID=A0A0C3L294_9AGAM|nr:carbohydrate-binding module family 1 protein [Tulasnella calospora MUT 4182]